MSDTTENPVVEDVESFRQRARSWLADNMPPAPERGRGPMSSWESDEAELAEMTRQRGLQRTLFDGGFAGIVVPREYGGQGLTPAHHQAFSEELSGYEYPAMLQVPNFTPCMAVILDFGNHEQKLRHIPPILKGENVWVQYLSEPSSGSDAAGAQTMAMRDGDEWILNGSKIWSSGAWRADWGLCLARTNAEVPKHRGLSVFLVPAHAEGIEMHRIEMLSGSKEFCQEFMTDVRIPEEDRLGDVDDGWTIGIRWLFHERSFAMSPYIVRPGGGDMMTGGSEDLLVRLARKSGRISDQVVRDKIGEVRADGLVARAAGKRIAQAMQSGHLNDQAAALSRLLSGVNGTRHSTYAFDIAGPSGVAWDEDDADLGQRGLAFLSRQAGEIGGGTTEMARNVISERVLGMPRERDDSRDIPFRDVAKGPTNR
jgi:alkylation response protein AidB-like acyl-CoA dehydrogenase